MMPSRRPAARVLVLLSGIPLHGQERGNIEVFRALKARGVEALFVTHAGYGHESIQPHLDGLGLRWTTAAFPGFWSLRPRVFWERLRELVSSNRAVLRAAREFQPTHVHFGNERTMLNLLPAVLWLKLPVIFRLGDAPRAHRLPFRLSWRFALGPSIRELVAISAYVRDCVVNVGVPEGKVRVIRSAPPVRPPRAGGSDLPLDLQEEISGVRPRWPGRTVVYIGQLSEEKGVGLLVEAARQLCADDPDVRFLLAGDYTWNNPFATGLMRALERDGLAQRIRFIGYTSDIESLLALADVHTAPSVWNEPLSNVVGEAKRAGVPSVVFPSGGLPELVYRQGDDGLVCADRSEEALVEGLRHYLAMDDGSIRAAGAAARASLAWIGLSSETYVAAWYNVFASASEAARRRRALPAVAPPQATAS